MEISNQHLTAAFKTKGAELTSLKKGNQEYIWQADPEYWGRHAPVLFPIVGRLIDDTYIYEGKEYQMNQHGFARDQEFEVVAHEKDSISFALKETEDTLKIYPFRFLLTITYTLKEKSLVVHYQVDNPNDKDLLFSIGAHPAFNCPMDPGERRSDYILTFEKPETFRTLRLIDGNFTGQTEVISDGNDLRITDKLFDKDALVFKNLRSSSVSLYSAEAKWLTFHFDGFPYLGIWSKDEDSPFVCIEPWYGLADNVQHTQKLKDKEGIRVLPTGGTFSCSYRVKVR